MGRQRKTPNSEFLLDKFRQANLKSWEKTSDANEEFHVRLFYHLEGLRNLHKEKLCDALHSKKLPFKKDNSWFRIVDFRYSNEFLSTKGSLIRGGRFNIGNDLDPRKFPPFPVLYIAQDYDTAYIERFGAPSAGLVGHEFALRDPPSFSAVRLSFELSNIFDLSTATNLYEFARVISRFAMPADLKTLGKSIGKSPPLAS